MEEEEEDEEMLKADEDEEQTNLAQAETEGMEMVDVRCGKVINQGLINATKSQCVKG